jgi:hypothetical protein
MWWTADKVAYRNRDDFVRAYQGTEVIWDKDCKKIFYTSTSGQVIIPNTGGYTDVYIFGANMVSNTYTNGVGVIEFDGPVTKMERGVDGLFSETDLSSIVLPQSLVHLQGGQFLMTDLVSLEIPANTTWIGQGLAGRSENLITITVDPNNTVYDSRDNCNAIIHTERNTLVAGCNTTVIPNTVEIIGYQAFMGFLGITSLTLPNSVKIIQDQAFLECNNLRYVDFGSVEVIGSNAFFRNDLVSVDLPSSLRELNSLAFCYNYNLSSITVDSNNTVYDSRNNCNAVIETATNKLIQGCSGTVIPSSVTSIGKYAFYGTGITSIVIPSSITVIPESCFYKCNLLTNIILPSSLTEIGVSAFEGTGLTSVTIPSSVTKIGYSAFENCSDLTEVIVNCTVPPDLGLSSTPQTFDNNAPGRLIKVPAASLQDYLTAPGWSNYADKIVAQ